MIRVGLYRPVNVNVTGERQQASSTLRSFLERSTSLALGIIHILNHDSPSKKRAYWGR
jgi:hypothetical protein